MKPIALIVDDDHDIIQFIVDCVKNMGFQCVFTYRVEDALQLLSDNKMRVAIVDIFMPGMGGIEGIKRIKAANKDCRIIAISGGFQKMCSDDALKAAHKIGADAVLSKPFRIKEIRETIREVLGGLSEGSGNEADAPEPV